ncbi:MAG: N-acetylmuramoyl-L-alanine amidase [Oscillatoriales cyanobacterium CG2_30_44_21]|nr:MAG: N-acetylmuramoyl-L-alanine amidase [Oscillatoriales cyanobacterium CG2_30_44_21]
MRRLIGIFLIGMLSFLAAKSLSAQTPNQEFIPPKGLHLTYPPLQHQTTSDRLFFIGTAPKNGNVSINDKLIQRSDAGHFAPSLPLQLGENNFNIEYAEGTGDHPPEKINVKVIRASRIALPPTEFGFISDSLFPAVDIARQPNERICFDAIATPKTAVSVRVGDQNIAMLPRRRNVQLPPNSSVLTGDNEANAESPSGYFRGCTTFEVAGQLGKPEYELRQGDRLIKQAAKGKLEILSPKEFQIAHVKAIAADARTGASTDFSRLTPLPQGTKALITGKQGNWLRFDYGGWVRDSLVTIEEVETLPKSIVRSVSTKRIVNSLNNIWTEVKIPLEVPVPISIVQSDRLLTLTLHNVTAQTDTISIDPDSIINKIDWEQADPDKVIYKIQLKPKQQWGYKVLYQGTNLIIALKHPPQISQQTAETTPLQGTKILLDAGHGSQEDLGSRGPTGYPEKDVTLITSKLLETELRSRGAKVIMTRTDDSDVLLEPRVNLINQEEPTLAISIHYNALPDDGDAINTAGVGAFWYNSQAQDFASFINTYLVKKLDRRDYGVFWNNLALARPTIAPSVLLELGFMINPVEFEWIIDPQQQQILTKTLADGITEWILNAVN